MNPIFDHTLPLEERVACLLRELTLDEKLNLLPSRQAAVPRLGIKAYNVCAEGAHGLLVRKYHDQFPSGKSTVFPQPIGLSCTWDKYLLKKVGNIIGTEARIWYEIDDHEQWLTLWFPTIDMERDPRWGRNEEAYGEDPFLAGKLSSHLIRGVQGEHPFYLQAACSPKHFYGNNMEKNRASASTDIGERIKHEYYLRVFEYAFVEGKAHSVMMAYNEVNKMPCLINPENVALIREKWGCEGYFVSDGDDLPQMVTAHNYCKTHAEGIALAIKAGADNFPVQKNELVTEPAMEALEKGLLTEDDIDRAVGNIMKTRFRLGQFDPAQVNPYTAISKDKLCCREHLQTALDAAHEAVVLLKNDGILPLDPLESNKILVIGDLAEKNLPDWYSGRPPHSPSLLAEMQRLVKAAAKKSGTAGTKIDTIEMHDLCVIYSNKHNAWLRVDDDGIVCYDGDENSRTVFREIDWGFNAVSYVHTKTGKYLNINNELKLACTSDLVWGWFTMEQFFRDEESGEFLPHSFTFMNRYSPEENKAIDKLTKGLRTEIITNVMAPIAGAAAGSDTVMLVLGNHPLINARECFDRSSIELPKRWKKLIDTVAEVNKNLILVLVAGYPYAFPDREINMRAVLYSAHGEQDAGTALADVIFGKYGPGGCLSQTWYRSDSDLPPIEDYDIINNPRTYMYFEGDVQYPFGHGLWYTQFSYDNPSAEWDDEIDGGRGGFYVHCYITNIGSHVSDFVIQVYAQFHGVPVKAPIRKLVGFERMNFDPGQSWGYKIPVPMRELRLYDEQTADFTITPQSVTFQIGASSRDIKCNIDVDTSGR